MSKQTNKTDESTSLKSDGGIKSDGGTVSQSNDSLVNLSLRERKKEQTRQALEKAILCLVIEKGYEEVTVEEVCQKVVFHVRPSLITFLQNELLFLVVPTSPVKRCF